MQLSHVLIGVLALTGLYLLNTLRTFYINIRAAQRSGLPYTLLPVYPFNPIWLLTHPLWLALLRRCFPLRWLEPWIHYLHPDYPYHLTHTAYAPTSSLLLVSPSAINLLTADPEAITQLTTRRTDFPKPVHIYAGIDQYGPNVVSAEGSAWRHHRRITSPPFNERNNALVWTESLYQAGRMLEGWVGEDKDDSGTLRDVATAAMRVSLHVISRSGFGVRLMWPHEKGAEEVLGEGHELSYHEALITVLEKLVLLIVMPKWMLRTFNPAAYKAYNEWGRYMREMAAAKRADVDAGVKESSEGMDLMRALVLGTADDNKLDTRLTTDEVLGNAFVFILAGHETAANTIHFSLLYLAMHPPTQQTLQTSLDDILGSRPVSEWSFDSDLPQLFNSMCGAVMNEELRLIPPVVGIPKSTLPNKPQTLHLHGKDVTVPGGCMITIDTVAVHRHPDYWPHTSAADLNEFRPERWIVDPKDRQNTEDHDEDSPHILESASKSDLPPLFHPPKSAYIPFSDGHRSCLGRRFAQVEILAVLAVIFKTWTVELDVSDWMSDAEFERASAEERRAVWVKADQRARRLLKEGMSTVITIQMRGERVPLRFVRRGRERFAGMGISTDL